MNATQLKRAQTCYQTRNQTTNKPLNTLARSSRRQHARMAAFDVSGADGWMARIGFGRRCAALLVQLPRRRHACALRCAATGAC
jgi:hypothetical protein